MQKKIIITVLILFTLSGVFAQKADDIIGEYRLPNKLDINIFKHNNKYYGKIIALNGYEGGQTTDYKNPDVAQRNDKLLDKIIIKNLKYNVTEKKWEGGTMYGPEKGMEFYLDITKMRKSEIEIVASKYFFWKTMQWKKI